MKRKISLVLIITMILLQFSWTTIQVSALGGPDLIVEKMAVGDSNKLSVTIKNIGDGPLLKGWTGSAQISLFGKVAGSFDLRYPNQETGGGIAAAGGSAIYHLSWEIQQATPVACFADINREIQETNENNNGYQTTLTPLPDLVIEMIRFYQSDQTIHLTIKNAGKGDTSTSFRASISLNDPFYFVEGEVEAILKAGAVTTLQFNFPEIPAGPLAIVLGTADSRNSIAESNELNNQLKMTFPITTPTPSPTSSPAPSPTPKPTVTPKPTPATTTGQQPSPTPAATTGQQPSPTPSTGPEPSPTPATSPVPSPSPAPVPVPKTAPVALDYLALTATPQVLQVASDSAEIFWSTNRDSSGRVRFRKAGDSLDTLQEDQVNGQKHQVSLTGLEPAALYQFIAESGDAAGHLTESRILYFRTLPAGEQKKPAIDLKMAPALAGKNARIEALSDDGPKISRVIFSIDGKPAFTDYAAPFLWELDTSVFDDGYHDFGAVGYDTAGNAVAASRGVEIRNRLAAGALSPVRVRITAPGSDEAVMGDFNICAEISHDLGLKVSRIEFWIDDAKVHEEIYDPAIDLTPILSPVFTTVLRWHAGMIAGGEHVVNVRVLDEAGNWGSDSQRMSSVRRVETVLTITRDVLRRGSFFEITLHFRNDGPHDISGLSCEETCQSLQALPDARSRRGADGEFTPLVSPAEVARVTGTLSDSHLEADLQVLRAGETKSLQYDAVPILRDPYDAFTAPVIGASFRVSFESAGIPHYESMDLSYPLSADEFNTAVQASDYLIMTCPATIMQDEIFRDEAIFFNKLGELARARNGVLGDVSEFRTRWGAASVRQLIAEGGTWASWMAPGWIREGYLLIVGEDNIIPAWTTEHAVLSDYPYANTLGGDAPELRVGRIIGNSARELVVPIENSLSGAYSAAKALLVSGTEGTWEPFIRETVQASQILAAAGIDAEMVHTEYWTTDYEMLLEALLIKNQAHSREGLFELTPFLLRRIGPPRGADETVDLMAYTPTQLVSWLLWARGFLSDAATWENAIGNAPFIVSRWVGNPSLDELVWLVLEGMIKEGESAGLLTSAELAAWLLWEEMAPRGALAGSDLGSVTLGSVSEPLNGLSLLRMISNAGAIVNEDRLILARRCAEAIQAARPERGGTYSPWRYTYCSDFAAADLARSARIKSLAAEGQDIICFSGHGSPSVWAGALADLRYAFSEIEPISFGGRNPVVMAFSCSTGYYTSGPQYDSTGRIIYKMNPSISEAFLQNGAAVYIGATELMSNALANDLMSARFWRYFPSDRPVGDSLHALKTATYALDPGWTSFRYYFNLYGDPKYGQR